MSAFHYAKLAIAIDFSKKYIKNEHVLYIRTFYFQDNLYTTVLRLDTWLNAVLCCQQIMCIVKVDEKKKKKIFIYI